MSAVIDLRSALSIRIDGGKRRSLACIADVLCHRPAIYRIFPHSPEIYGGKHRRAESGRRHWPEIYNILPHSPQIYGRKTTSSAEPGEHPRYGIASEAIGNQAADHIRPTAEIYD